MKYELKIILSSILVIFFTNILNANDDFVLNEKEIKSKSLYIKYSFLPKIIYTKQRFKVKLQVNILGMDDNVSYRLYSNIQESNKNIDLITKDIIWNKIDDNNYESTLQFKVLGNSVELPIIEVSLMNENNIIIDKAMLNNKKITYRKIAINQKKYSNVIAKEFMVQSIKTKQYNNKQLLHVLAIKAKQSNLEDFNLSMYDKQEIKILENIQDEQMMFYVVITSRGEKEIQFNYFNTSFNKFIDVTLEINLNEKLVSTQTDLNPYANDMFIYKILSLSVLILFFLMLYYYKKEILFLFFAIIFMTLLMYMIWPNDDIILKKDTKVYILPTFNSTVFYILKEDEQVNVLIKQDEFSKVLFANENIGWIKNEKN